MGLDPADFEAVKNIAKGMSKQDLEEYYVKDKDKRHFGCVDVIGILLILGIMVLAIFFLGWTIGTENVEDKISDVLEETSLEICPTMGRNYYSETFFKSSLSVNRIDCTKVSSYPQN